MQGLKPEAVKTWVFCRNLWRTSLTLR
ncbi:hypothetical protein Hamer_G023544 [Homarus americanus]|uniref:Uncharacterized protein n=1 Tax=Homarus americanus TaxID=6706 RepID=A0A8J5JZP9_HOMAM|nr:hypothetical protein Hamer_G023544 [Homarus americanus]